MRPKGRSPLGARRAMPEFRGGERSDPFRPIWGESWATRLPQLRTARISSNSPPRESHNGGYRVHRGARPAADLSIGSESGPHISFQKGPL